MRILDAALHLARRFPGGIEAVAPLLPSTDPSKPPGSTKSVHSLRHELTGAGTAKFGLEDAELVTMRALQLRVDRPLAILDAFAANCGAMVVPLPQAYDADDITIAGLAAVAKEAAEFMGSVAKAIEDGKVSDNELGDVDRELGELIGRVQAVRARVAQLHATGKAQQQLRAV
jgi:hypothetical protein